VEIDARILFIFSGLFCWVLAAVVELYASAGRRSSWQPDLVTAALFSQGLGLLLFSQRGALPAFLTVYVANVLILLTFSLFYAALQTVQGQSWSRLVGPLPVAIIAFLFPIIGFSDDVVAMRVLVYTITSFAAYSIVAASALQTIEKGRMRGPLLITAALILIAVVQWMRALRVIDMPRVDLFANESPQLVFNAIILGVIACVTFGYLDVMRGQRARVPGHPG
jgi:uncharacterized membrane protein YoaK (UPF0700 family)